MKLPDTLTLRGAAERVVNSADYEATFHEDPAGFLEPEVGLVRIANVDLKLLNVALLIDAGAFYLADSETLQTVVDTIRAMPKSWDMADLYADELAFIETELERRGHLARTGKE